jgi:hypothetical protein
MTLGRRLISVTGKQIDWHLDGAQVGNARKFSAMNRRHFIAMSLAGSFAAVPRFCWAKASGYLEKAQSLIPQLRRVWQEPLALVSPVADAAQVLRFRMVQQAPASTLEQRLLGKGDAFILDFGGHRTGTVRFELAGEGQGVDAPVRLRLTFGEVPTDVAEPLRPYTGQLAEGWLPEEVVVVDDLPQVVEIKRRYAFRYVKVEVFDTSNTFKVRFRNFRAIAVTSAGQAPLPLASGDKLLDRIDEVSLATLRDCMQSVFEDGPRRDRRLWVGDLRLQALTAYQTFGGHDLVKRCLYLFAAFAREDGLIEGCVYEKPKPGPSGIPLFDYTALWNVCLADYAAASGDLDTARDLWPVALKQIELLSVHVKQGLFVDPKTYWLFIDWAEKLDRSAAVQGVLIFAFERTLELARRIGRASEVALLPKLINDMRRAAQEHLYDPRLGLFVSGPDRQISWASQAWLVIAKAAPSQAAARLALRNAMANPSAIRPTTPYLYHYVLEAMVVSGMKAEALKLLKSYWGGMVEAGADTFWEVYDPNHPLNSPYGDIHINSYCHAWSCTPAWFLRSGKLGASGQ